LHVKWRIRFERVWLVAGMAVSSVSLWTACPLLGLWVGSRVAANASGGISMLAVFTVAVVIFVSAYAMVRSLSVLDVRWKKLTGNHGTVRQHVPWLRSMRGERPSNMAGVRAELSPLEVVLVLTVVACFIAFEIWFFFYSSSPIDQRSGRS
jgi:hypothetical protein